MTRLGGRTNPFSAGPTLICLPPGTRYCFTSLTATLDMAVSLTPADPGLPVAILGPNDVPENRAGAKNWSRTIRPGTSVAPTTRRLMMAETLVPPGNWTSYPPHKHDVENPPTESIYEEVYFYLFKPAGGYGFQRVYEPGDDPDRLNEVYVVEDGDAVAIPGGYHPLVAAAGYQLVYIWALCGVHRVYGAWSDDPDSRVDPRRRGHYQLVAAGRRPESPAFTERRLSYHELPLSLFDFRSFTSHHFQGGKVCHLVSAIAVSCRS